MKVSKKVKLSLWSLSPWLKQPRYEDDHSLKARAEVNYALYCTSTLLRGFVRNNLTVLPYYGMKRLMT
jgi:hypothetical protein